MKYPKWKTASTVLAFALFALASNVCASSVIADWNFSERIGTTLNNTVNSGAGVGGTGSSWGTDIKGTATDGAGALSIRNDGKGGGGTRSAYADFGPNFEQVTSDRISLYARFSSWFQPQAGQTFTLGFIEGSDFTSAEFSLGRSGSGFLLTGGVDTWGDGAALAQSAYFESFSPLTVRLDVNFMSGAYSLAYDVGAGYASLGSASFDSYTQGINSLRMAFDGNFSDSALNVDRIWVMESTVSMVPEPASLALLLAGLLLVAGFSRRRSAGDRLST